MPYLVSICSCTVSLFAEFIMHKKGVHFQFRNGSKYYPRKVESVLVLIQLLSFVTVYKDSMKVLQGSTRVRVVRQGRGLGPWYKHGIIHPGKEVLFAKVVGGSVEVYTLSARVLSLTRLIKIPRRSGVYLAPYIVPKHWDMDLEAGLYTMNISENCKDH